MPGPHWWPPGPALVVPAYVCAVLFEAAPAVVAFVAAATCWALDAPPPFWGVALLHALRSTCDPAPPAKPAFRSASPTDCPLA